MMPLIDTAQLSRQQLERRDAVSEAHEPSPATDDRRAWNVLVTAKPIPGAERELLHGLRRFGEFHPTPYACVFVGRVHDTSVLLDAVQEAEQAGRAWTKYLSRVVPVVSQFEFAPEALDGKLMLAAERLVDEARSGSFQVRGEWRGAPPGAQISRVEDVMARALISLGEARGKRLLRTFDDPDYIVAVEIVGESCGVGLLDPALCQRYAFIRMK